MNRTTRNERCEDPVDGPGCLTLVPDVAPDNDELRRSIHKPKGGYKALIALLLLAFYAPASLLCAATQCST
ncbi:hypothetical protein C8R43DRAFT_1113771 [Mycena crocata]|nr:hypothetical protein C8R43DRAFT_1113771 [Mycena crocata]